MDGLLVYLASHGGWTTGRTFDEAEHAWLASLTGASAALPTEQLWQAYGVILGYPTNNVNQIQKLWMAATTGLSATLDFQDLRNALRLVP